MFLRRYSAISTGWPVTFRQYGGTRIVYKDPDALHLACDFELKVRKKVLWTILIILLVLWLLGFGVFSVLGNLIHILLVVALVVLVLQLVSGRRAV
jgi:hypothetical protein